MIGVGFLWKLLSAKLLNIIPQNLSRWQIRGDWHRLSNCPRGVGAALVYAALSSEDIQSFFWKRNDDLLSHAYRIIALWGTLISNLWMISLEQEEQELLACSGLRDGQDFGEMMKIMG